MSEAITEEMVQKTAQEIEKNDEIQVQAKIEEERAKISEEQTKQLEEMKSKMMEEIEAKQKAFDEQLKERDQKLETMKADFDKQMETISMRKSVPANEPKKEEPKVSYWDAPKDVQDKADKEYLQSLGIRF